jgi:hypothetical protein
MPAIAESDASTSNSRSLSWLYVGIPVLMAIQSGVTFLVCGYATRFVLLSPAVSFLFYRYVIVRSGVRFSWPITMRIIASLFLSALGFFFGMFAGGNAYGE